MRRMFPGIRELAFVTFVAASLCFPARPQIESQSSRSDRKTSVARRMNVEGIPNIAEVTPKLYRGGVPSKEGLQTLANMGINIVVDLRGSNKVERKEATDLGMRYVALPWHCPFPRDAVFAHFLNLLQENRDKKVFVHCRLGDDRAGMMIAAYRMAEQSWTPEEAMKEMELYGFTFSHRFICPGLASYESHFPQRFKSSPAFESVRKELKPLASHPQ
jgi:hypothetical protein